MQVCLPCRFLAFDRDEEQVRGENTGKPMVIEKTRRRIHNNAKGNPCHFISLPSILVSRGMPVGLGSLFIPMEDLGQLRKVGCKQYSHERPTSDELHSTTTSRRVRFG